MQIQYPGIMQLCSPSVRFQWNDDLEKELQDLKRCLKEFVKISPIDTSKGLELVIGSAATYCSRGWMRRIQARAIVSSQWILPTFDEVS